SAPEFKGYTPAPAQIDETTVNEDTQDTTVEISYTANKTPEQPDHSKDKDQGQNPQTPDSNENGKHYLSTGENTESSGSTTKPKAPATAKKVTKNLPQTGENTESSGSTTNTKVLATANKVTKNLPQTGENTESSGSTTNTKVPATANKVTKNLPQTGEKENQLGLLGIVLASLGVFGLGWKKRKHE
ncbi:mucus-binding protein, partial [Lactobacillus crispatus]|uniref:LPXTG cell wall anchor domain-containing protein n=1 Tax=Lactobacillus crispatus TaxID=47770 RepID=UPI0018E32296